MAIGQQSFNNLKSEYGTRYFRIRKDFVMIEVCQTATNIIFFFNTDTCNNMRRPLKLLASRNNDCTTENDVFSIKNEFCG